MPPSPNCNFQCRNCGIFFQALFGAILSILIVQKIKCDLTGLWSPLWLTIKASLQFLLLTFGSWVAVSRLVGKRFWYRTIYNRVQTVVIMQFMMYACSNVTWACIAYCTAYSNIWTYHRLPPSLVGCAGGECTGNCFCCRAVLLVP